MVDLGTLIAFAASSVTILGFVVYLVDRMVAKRKHESEEQKKGRELDDSARRRVAAAKTLNDRVRALSVSPAITFLSYGPYKSFERDPKPSDAGFVRVDLTDGPRLPEIVQSIVERHKDAWTASNLWESNDVVGVREVGYFAVGPQEYSSLVIKAGTYRYFELLATNLNISARRDLLPPEKEWLDRQVKNAADGAAVPTLVNPLGVHVLVLCDGGSQFVLQTRGQKTAFRAGLRYPSAAEAVSTAKDLADGAQDRVDVEKTVYRSLEEELGIERVHVESISLTSLVYDREVRKFDLTAIAITDLAPGAIVALRDVAKAKDRFEAEGLTFHPFPTRFAAEKMRLTWAPEAIGCYMAAVVNRCGWQSLSDSIISGPAAGSPGGPPGTA